MTPEQHNTFIREVANTTNFCCVATIWICPIPSVPVLLAIAGLLLTVCWSVRECRRAERRYQQTMKEYLDAGGMVMLVKRGRRWMPVPVPVHLPPRDIP